MPLDFRTLKEVNERLRHGEQVEYPLFEQWWATTATPSSKPFVVYRGIPHMMNLQVGGTMSALGYLFTTLNKEYALMYTEYDTTPCYVKQDFSFWDAQRSTSQGILFQIDVPPGILHINDESNDEIIFQKHHSFLVKKITSETRAKGLRQIKHMLTYTLVECDLLN